MSISTNLYVIAAICGNFYQESTVNPGIWEGLTPNAPGYGLGQWTDNPPQVMRRTALFNWLDANNYPHDSGDGQLAFLVYENLWIPSLFQQSAYNTLGDFFATQSQNLADLVREWMWHWEGIDDGTLGVRYDAAAHFLSAFQSDDGTRLPWFTGNYYLQLERESTDNALRIMDFFLGSEPPTPPGPDEPTEEEILAVVRMALKRRKRGGGVIVF